MASSTRTARDNPQASALDRSNGHTAANFFPLQSLSMGLSASQQLMSFFVNAQRTQLETVGHMTDTLTRAIEAAREAREPAKIFAIQLQLVADQMTHLVNQSLKLFGQASSTFAETLPATSPAAPDGGSAAQDPTNALAAPMAMMGKMPEVWLGWAKQWNTTMGHITRPS